MSNDAISRQEALDEWNRLSERGRTEFDQVLMMLPSAEPEIIHCKDCKHHHYEKDIPYCDRIDYGYGWKDNDYCSRPERRTDE